MELTNWIDKYLTELRKNKTFEELFSDKELINIEHNKHLYNPEKGLDMVMDDYLKIHTIHLYSGNTSDGKEFMGGRIHHVDFSMNRESVKNILGEPNRTGGGYKAVWGMVPLWDKYYFEKYFLHLQYSQKCGSIDLITIGSLSLESDLNSSLQ